MSVMILEKYAEKQGFTLAEVLVTLAIIGIVAALTIPSLITSYNDNVTETAVKKTFANISNAWGQYREDKGGSVIGTWNGRWDLKDKFLKKYFSYIQESSFGVNTHSFVWLNDETDVWSVDAGIITSDGQIISIGDNNAANCQLYAGLDTCAWVLIDINGKKEPNRTGYDCFWVMLTSTKVIPYDPRYADNHAVNTSCIQPGHANWNAWYNGSAGCLKRILTNQPKWSS